MNKPEIDPDLIDEAVLALLYLTLHREGGPMPVWRAWKSFDWEALGRLHDKELILDPVGKAKSVMMTQEGQRRSEEAFYRLFAQQKPQAGTGARAGKQKPPEACSRGSCLVGRGKRGRRAAALTGHPEELSVA